MQLTSSTIESLQAAARAAPSADNRHVFQLDFEGDRIRVFGTDDFTTSLQNRRVLGLLSIGAVVENVLLRGARLGLAFELHRDAPGHQRKPIVELRLVDRSAVPDPLEQAIENRHSNRRLFYGRTALDASQHAAFDREAAMIPGSSLVWLDETMRRSEALKLIRWAETERFRRQELHQEMFESIRFDIGWKTASAEGIPPGALDIPVFERVAFSALRHWRVQRIANLLGAHRFIGFRAGDLPCRLAPHLGVITAAGDVDEATLQAGRLLQRIWLRATTQSLAMQVFAASPLFALPGSDFVDRRLRDRLAAGWQALSPRSRPYLVFRLGHAPAASVRAGRPTASAETISAEAAAGR